MSGVRVLVGTRKGAFILTADGKRDKWTISEPLFGGPLPNVAQCDHDAVILGRFDYSSLGRFDYSSRRIRDIMSRLDRIVGNRRFIRWNPFGLASVQKR